MRNCNKIRKALPYRVITAALLAVCMGIIFWFSAQPSAESSEMSGSLAYRIVADYNEVFHRGYSEGTIELYAERIDYPIRKAAHMTEYAILAWLIMAVLRGYFYYGKKTLFASVALAACYASTDEIHQLVVEGRAGRFSDVCIDTAGALLGLALLHFLHLCYRKHCEKDGHQIK